MFHSAPDLGALAGIMVYGGFVGYLAIAIAGVPVYLATRDRLRLAHVIGTAVLAGAVTLSLMAKAPFELRTMVFGALYGLSAGVAFWLVWRRNAAQQAVAADGASPRR
jgi:hypothetical protein